MEPAVLEPRFVQDVRKRLARTDPALSQLVEASGVGARDRAVERIAHLPERDAQDVTDEPDRFLARVVRAMAVEQTGARETALDLAPPLAHSRREVGAGGSPLQASSFSSTRW